ncbi:lactoylglutathione lyase [Lentisphaera profundi]|uniref:Lactoylglutathione lyase n=1 Tax=Lentisphaera profundi TaxID=1658616 RepID=A0ABY7VQS6_9BACT|nr:lactoylglutathione lyase [Lentisphaera profundi]WDE96196.1 lactoylglutathione lyase [Lentisphaera profundi]
MKFLHTMIRVGNLEHSIKFYTENFGMKLIRQKDYPGGKFTLAFIGYGEEADNTVIELTHNWETDSYEVGNGFGHFAIGVEDIYAVCDKLREDNVIITREPGPMKHGTTLIAFVKDPDGYSIELIERKEA